MAVAPLTLGVAAVPPMAQADGPPRVVVDSDGPARFWDGIVRVDGPTIRRIPQCRTVHCDRLELKVVLPRDTWRRAGGVQVAIRWDGASEGSLGLFVYRDDKLVASSAAVVGAAQSVLIPSARNGSYDVYVAYGVTFGAVDPDPVIPYEGLAEVDYDPAVQPLRDLVPDLAALRRRHRPGRLGREGGCAAGPPGAGCLEPKLTIGTTEFLWYGISRGWADRYNWYLPDQMIDTVGLSDGTYVLFTTVDPDNKLLEASEANNCGSVIVELTGLATDQPHANLLGTGPAARSRPRRVGRPPTTPHMFTQCGRRYLRLGRCRSAAARIGLACARPRGIRGRR